MKTRPAPRGVTLALAVLSVTSTSGLTACAGPDDAAPALDPAPAVVTADPDAESIIADPAEPLPADEPSGATGLYAFKAQRLDGSDTSLSEYAGRVALVVNVASHCGYTPQYAGLQSLSEEFADQGLLLLAFPSNEFGGQEPGSPEEIAAFCTGQYGVTFPLFEKCEVKDGPGQSPIYSFLQEQTGEVPSWNFCKYLVARDGHVLAFYPSKVAPSSEQLRADIAAALD